MPGRAAFAATTDGKGVEYDSVATMEDPSIRVLHFLEAVARLLIDNGADVKAQSKDGSTALVK